ncbi:hypothetical protein B9Z55_018059 [Caenorhabditis nigoni]|uniref:Uncharacterized protein n=1 Tax=Caenorhabditis nigoni TaxID=1611254 RepID=A0A2G5TC33_9PELO|nr:hypothetical protein B9Z55_018059 [Caenorhabditis nigoni]
MNEPPICYSNCSFYESKANRRGLSRLSELSEPFLLTFCAVSSPRFAEIALFYRTQSDVMVFADLAKKNDFLLIFS